MALRRLLSGWLIAVAALARSMALDVGARRGDRSEPTPASVPDPVMAALAERYPGAPAHWLALVAERTSQLAQAGEVPLSLTSDAIRLAGLPPGAAGPLEPLPPTLAEAEPTRESRSRAAPRPARSATLFRPWRRCRTGRPRSGAGLKHQRRRPSAGVRRRWSPSSRPDSNAGSDPARLRAAALAP
jgi:hypothetical protein